MCLPIPQQPPPPAIQSSSGDMQGGRRAPAAAFADGERAAPSRISPGRRDHSASTRFDAARARVDVPTNAHKGPSAHRPAVGPAHFSGPDGRGGVYRDGRPLPPLDHRPAPRPPVFCRADGTGDRPATVANSRRSIVAGRHVAWRRDGDPRRATLCRHGVRRFPAAEFAARRRATRPPAFSRPTNPVSWPSTVATSRCPIVTGRRMACAPGQRTQTTTAYGGFAPRSSPAVSATRLHVLSRLPPLDRRRTPRGMRDRRDEDPRRGSPLPAA